MADYEAMVQQLMDALAAPGREYEGAPYSSKDPGTHRYRSGEVEPDVGWLDPVDLLAGMLASKGASLVRRAGRALTEPGPSLRPMLRSQRGSTGSWWDDEDEIFPSAFPDEAARPVPGGPRPRDLPDDPLLPPAMRAEVDNAKARINAVMGEYLEARGGEASPGYYDIVEPEPGENTLAYLRRLLKLEKEYNADSFYGPGEFPPSRLEQLIAEHSASPTGKLEAAALEAADKRIADAASRWTTEEQRVNPYEAGEGPAKRTIDMNAPETPPPSRAQEYADIIRKLFEQGGR